MKKVWNQVAYNLKKDRSSYISFGIIILITALILNCAAVLLVQVDPAYVAKFEKLNTADINVLVPEFGTIPTWKPRWLSLTALRKQRATKRSFWKPLSGIFWTPTLP